MSYIRYLLLFCHFSTQAIESPEGKGAPALPCTLSVHFRHTKIAFTLFRGDGKQG